MIVPLPLHGAIGVWDEVAGLAIVPVAILLGAVVALIGRARRGGLLLAGEDDSPPAADLIGPDRRKPPLR